MSIRHNGKVIAGATQYHPDLFDWKWADHQLNDVQWLRADTFSWQSGAVYQAAYNHLASDITGKTLQSETISGITIQFYLADDGHKICPASEESNVTAIYNATGVAWYYIIDTTNQRFKLPRAKHNKYADTVAVVGNGITLGFTDGTNNYGLEASGNNPNNYLFRTGDYGKNVGASGGDGSTGTGGICYGITTDASKSGVIAQQTQDTDQYKYLYFYVGNFTQTALENTAGLNASLFNNKADINLQNATSENDFVIERQEPTALNNYTWYRKYRSGWVEQGGTASSTSEDLSVTLPVTMANNNYQVQLTLGNTTRTTFANQYWSTFGWRAKTTTGFTCTVNVANAGTKDWFVCGMAAS